MTGWSLARRMRFGSNVLLREIFETGGKFGSCWSEVMEVIIKVKASNTYDITYAIIFIGQKYDTVQKYDNNRPNPQLEGLSLSV